MKVKPTIQVAVGVFVAYLVIVSVMWFVVDLDYDTIAESSSTVRDGVAISLGVGTLFLIIAVSALGWWRPTMIEDKRVGPSWAMWLIPLFLATGIVINLLAADWGEIDGGFIGWLLLGTAFVGFNEEMSTRGVMIVGGRGSFSSELLVWFVSCASFGLLHLINIAYGQSVAATFGQLVFAFVLGSVFYVIRRVTGLLVVTMILHGAWDFAQLSMDHTEASGRGGFMMYAAVIAAAVVMWKLFRTETHESEEAAVGT